MSGHHFHDPRFRWASLCSFSQRVLEPGRWVENEHFEQFVRIQSERNHRVVTTDPYRIVRHSGYVSFLLSTVAGPLMFGSVWSVVPAGLLVILFVWRTSREDATLQKELDGYAQYAEQTPYRLIPFVW